MNSILPRFMRVPWLVLLLATVSSQAQTVTAIRRSNPPATGINQIRVQPGDQVEILGSSLHLVQQVRFGNATAAIGGTSTRVVAIVPAGATIGPVSLYDSFGLFFATDFNFQVSPRVTSLARSFPPPTSPADAVTGVVGNSVQISGQNFVDPSDPGFTSVVYFPHASGGWVLAPTESVSPSTVQVRVPVGAVSGSLVVENPAGFVTTSGRFYLQPVINGFSPSAARVGDQVTLTGLSLLDTSEVLFGNVGVVPSMVTPTNLVVTVPNLTQSVRLSVVAPGGVFLTTSNLVLLPRVGSFTPAGGEPGTVVSIQGDGLSGVTAVRFGGVASVLVTNVSPNLLRAVVPAGAFAGPIQVTTVNGSSASATPFFVAPRFTDLSPSQGRPGDTVVLTGANFTNVSRVEFANGLASSYVVTATNRISAIVPAGTVSGLIRITTPGGVAVSPRNFVITPITPAISGLVPGFGDVGTAVLITGSNLGEATQVRFNGVAVAGFTVNGASSLTAVVPVGATSGRVEVTTPSGVAQSPVDFLVGSTADLLVSGQALPDQPVLGEEVVFSFAVQNRGPIPAVAASLSVLLPVGATFVEASTSRGTFQSFGSTIFFSPGNLGRNESVLTTVTARMGVVGTIRVTGQAGSDTPDPVLGDNQLELVVRPDRPRLGVTRTADGRVALTWASDPVNLILEGSAGLGGGWQAVPGTPENTANGRRLVVDPGESFRVFRLRLAP